VHRRLPHSKKEGCGYFVTWRLSGSMPVTKSVAQRGSAGSRFAEADAMLDRADHGPKWLVLKEVAEAIVPTMLQGEVDGEYELGPWVLMPDHVHLVFRPTADLAGAIRRLKGRTGFSANRVLGRSGPFWEKDYYDRLIRDAAEEARIARYIEQNPVRAGLCLRPGEWQWSSLWTRLQSRPGEVQQQGATS